MIDIIQHGSTFSKVSYTTHCPKCMCIFKFNIEDCERPTHGVYIVNCPECHEIIDVFDDIEDTKTGKM